MPQVKNLLIVVNSGADKVYNQYAAYVVAFMAKQIAKIEDVTVFYGPQGVGMAKKGELAKLAITGSVKELIASQIEGVSASDLPDNLEQLARFEKDKLGVNIARCLKEYLEGTSDLRIAVTCKPCDARAIIELAKRAQINLDNLPSSD